MNQTRFALKPFVATLFAASALAAGAQTPPPGGPMMGPGMGAPGGPAAQGTPHHRMDPAQMAQRMAQRQTALKQKLAITPAQEGAWTRWTEAMKPPANAQRPNHDEMAKLTTPERIDRMKALRTQRQAQMDQRAEATKQFYATLTPEQRKVFDAETARFAHREHRGEPQGQGHHGPQGHGMGHHS